MDFEDINNLVWLNLAKSNFPKSVHDISETEGLETNDVRRVIAKLYQLGLVQKLTENMNTYYRLKIALSALEWAQAVEFGISIECLENFSHLRQGSLDDVLKIASDGSIEKYKKQKAKERKLAHEKWVFGKKASLLAATDLAKLVNDIRKVKNESKFNLQDKNLSQISKAINDIYIEAERALSALHSSL